MCMCTCVCCTCVYVCVCVCVCVYVCEWSTQITVHIYLQTWTQLNHINVTISCDAILNQVNEISLHHTKVMDKWLRKGAFVKFAGDNVEAVQCTRHQE